MYSIGIDPGREGGLSILKGKDLIAYYKLPYNDGFLDLKKYLRMLLKYKKGKAYIEKQSIYFGRSTFKSGKTSLLNYGKLLAGLELLGILYREVECKTWQKEMLNEVVVEEKDKKKATKLKSLSKVNSLYNLALKEDGISDSILIALYGTEFYKE